MKLIIIGGLTNGKILIDYFLKKKNISIELIITYPIHYNIPRYKNLNISDKYQIPVVYDLDANKYFDLISKIKPDLIFVVGWSGMISQKIINLSKIGCIGFHPSKLPKDRGRSVIAWQIEEGKNRTSYTSFFMKKEPDTGDIIVQQNFKIEKNDYINAVLDKVDYALEKMLPKIYTMMRKKKFVRIKQNLKLGNYRKVRNDKNSLINWTKSAQDIYNKIRAISRPYPGAFYIKNNIKVKVWKSKILNLKINTNFIAGDVIKIYKNGNKVFMTNDKPILIYSNNNEKK